MTRAERLTQAVRTYDKALYVLQTNTGTYQVWRKEYPKDWDGLTFSARNEVQFILALTDDWTLKGKPVEWGIDPLLEKLKEMDAWRDDSYYGQMVKGRERDDANKLSRFKNNARAMAADVRKDVAKAAGDFIYQKGN